MSLTLYLREEPTTDSETRRHFSRSAGKCFDVVAYHSPEAVKPAARWPWFYGKSKPKRQHPFTNLNCCRYATQWLPRADSIEHRDAIYSDDNH